MRAAQPSLSCRLPKDRCVGRIIPEAHSGFRVEEAAYNERSQVTTKKI